VDGSVRKSVGEDVLNPALLPRRRRHPLSWRALPPNGLFCNYSGGRGRRPSNGHVFWRASGLASRHNIGSKLERNLQPKHERVVRLAEAARLDDVLNIRLHGKFLSDLDDVDTSRILWSRAA
jgi:hypothetical protein